MQQKWWELRGYFCLQIYFIVYYYGMYSILVGKCGHGSRKLYYRLDWFPFLVIIYVLFYIVARGGNKAQKQGGILPNKILLYKRLSEGIYRA